MIKMKFDVWSEIRKAAAETPRMYFSTVGDVVRVFQRARHDTTGSPGHAWRTVNTGGHRTVIVGDAIVRTRKLLKNRKKPASGPTQE